MNLFANDDMNKSWLIGASGENGSEPATNAGGEADRGVPVRTFDIFDTLIARRGIEPATIFRKVEEKTGIKGFADARRQAERNVLDAAHDLDVIYNELGRILGLDALQIAAIKKLEVDVEVEQVIPISENMARVRHGDLLISDMYLGEANIRTLLNKAGLDKKVGLIVTNDGKKKGHIWPEVSRAIAIEEHLGDNEHSDVNMPTSFGINSRHSRIWEPSPIEKIMITLGLEQLAQLCRELRLRTWSDDGNLRAIQIVQANLNFPLLLLASVSLADTARALGKNRLLFSSRDCDMWLPLFEEVARRKGFSASSRYFYTSRLTKMQPSGDYLEYSRRLLTPDALLIDVCGTGWSFSHLAQKLGMRDIPVFLFHKLPEAKAYEEHSRTPQTCTFHSIIGPGQANVQNTLLEMCNYSDHGMVGDVRMIGDVAHPVFTEDTRTQAEHASVQAQKDTFSLGISLMEHYDLRKILTLDAPSVQAVTAALYENMSQHSHLRKIYGNGHTAEEKQVRNLLGCR